MVTQAELARRAGVTENSLNRQERGTMKIRPSLARLYTLLAHYGDDACKVLGIEPKGRIRRYVRRRRVQDMKIRLKRGRRHGVH